MKQNDSFSLVIFGVTGNLAQLKLIPALYDLVQAGLLSDELSIVGIGRKEFTNDSFRNYVIDVLHQPNPHHQHSIDENIVSKLFKKIKYFSGDIENAEIYQTLNAYFSKTDEYKNKMFYLATYPKLYSTIFAHLESSGLNKEKFGWVRVMVEKPIGSDLQSAKDLNGLLSQYYNENQIFRLDHYLGKETMQNILTFRFGNGIFEPLINRDHIDHIQITASEDFGIGLRGGYYDTVGALKDVGQNHILQMLALTLMDAPKAFTNEDITEKRITLINQLRPDPAKAVYGQYEGYLREKDIKENSKADTYFAFKTFIDNDRFRDVPIYVRAGKKLARTVTEVAIIFKVPHGRLFSSSIGGLDPNILVYRIQPNEGIVLRILTKVPGSESQMQYAYMQYCYHTLGVPLPDPYLKLLLDALRGDQTFFIDAPEVESQWRFIDKLSNTSKDIEIYAGGTWGPAGANKLIESDGRSWIEPSVAFCAL